MHRRVLIEGFRMSVTVAPSLADAVCQAIRQHLNTRAFRRALADAVRALVRTLPAGESARVVVSN